MSQRHRDHIHDSKQDLHLQIGIFLWTLILALLLLCEFFFSLPLYGMVATAFILIISSLFFKVKYKDFYTYRDRGQRTPMRSHSLIYQSPFHRYLPLLI